MIKFIKLLALTLCISSSFILFSACNHVKTVQVVDNNTYDYHLQVEQVYNRISNHSTFNQGGLSCKYVVDYTAESSNYNCLSKLNDMYSYILAELQDILSTAKQKDEYYLVNFDPDTYVSEINSLKNRLSKVSELANNWSYVGTALKNNLDIVFSFDDYYTLAKDPKAEIKNHTSSALSNAFSVRYNSVSVNSDYSQLVQNHSNKVEELKSVYYNRAKVVDYVDYYTSARHTPITTNPNYINYSFDFYRMQVMNVDGSLRTDYFPWETAVSINNESYPTAYQSVLSSGDTYKLFSKFAQDYEHSKLLKLLDACSSQQNFDDLFTTVDNAYAPIVDSFNSKYDQQDGSWRQSNIALLIKDMEYLRYLVNNEYGYDKHDNKINVDTLANSTREKLDACTMSYQAYAIYRDFIYTIVTKDYAPFLKDIIIDREKSDYSICHDYVIDAINEKISAFEQLWSTTVDRTVFNELLENFDTFVSSVSTFPNRPEVVFADFYFTNVSLENTLQAHIDTFLNEKRDAVWNDFYQQYQRAYFISTHDTDLEFLHNDIENSLNTAVNPQQFDSITSKISTDIGGYLTNKDSNLDTIKSQAKNSYRRVCEFLSIDKLEYDFENPELTSLDLIISYYDDLLSRTIEASIQPIV